MKYYYLYLLIFIAVSIVSCNNDEKYLKLIAEENEILNHEIDRNYRIISKFSENNRIKYGPWKSKGKGIIDLRDTVLSNSDNLDVIKYAIGYLKDYTKLLGSENEHTYIELLNLNFDINNKVENAVFINKILIVSNSYIDRIVFLSNIDNFRFTCLNSIVRYNNWSGVFKKGEDIEACLFIAAVDTTVNPKITLKNGEMIDTFDNFGRGVYMTKADKRGRYSIEGDIEIKDEYNGKTYLFPFQTEYLVK